MKNKDNAMQSKAWRAGETTPLVNLVMAGYSTIQIVENFMFLFPGRSELSLKGKSVGIRKCLRPDTANTVGGSRVARPGKSEDMKFYKKLMKLPLAEDLDIIRPENSGIKPKYNYLLDAKLVSPNTTKIPASYNEPTPRDLEKENNQLLKDWLKEEKAKTEEAHLPWQVADSISLKGVSATLAPITLTTKKQNKINRIVTMLEAMEGDIEVSISSLDEKLSIKINSDD